MKNKILIATLLFATSFAAFAQPCTSCSTQTCSTVSLTVMYQGQSIYANSKIPWVQNMNGTLALYNSQRSQPSPALTFLTAIYCPYGSFLTNINGVAQQSGTYWALYVNDQYAQFGIDTQKINANDRIKFVYTQYKEGVIAQNKDSHQSAYFTHTEAKAKK